MEENQTTLWDRDKLYVGVRINDDGDLVIAGQDLDPPAQFGDEYEYWITVRAADISTVVSALGGKPGDDVIPLLVANAETVIRIGEASWIRGLGIEAGFHSWF